MMKSEYEDLGKLLQPYYAAGLIWETRGEMLVVYWGYERCIGSVRDILRLSGAQMEALLSVWFSNHKDWAMKHDGKLGTHEVETLARFVVISEPGGCVQLTAEQALSLLVWLEENKSIIEKLPEEKSE